MRVGGERGRGGGRDGGFLGECQSVERKGENCRCVCVCTCARVCSLVPSPTPYVVHVCAIIATVNILKWGRPGLKRHVR